MYGCKLWLESSINHLSIFAECYITISAIRLVLYFMYNTHNNALTYTYTYDLYYFIRAASNRKCALFARRMSYRKHCASIKLGDKLNLAKLENCTKLPNGISPTHTDLKCQWANTFKIAIFKYITGEVHQTQCEDADGSRRAWLTKHQYYDP